MKKSSDSNRRQTLGADDGICEPVTEPPDPVADICDRVESQVRLLTDVTTARIRDLTPAYARVPLAEHRRAVREQHRRRITLIAQNRSMTADDLRSAARLAETRAMQGVPVHDLIDAYHIGDQELWRVVVAAADQDTSALSQIASRMMESIHAISKASAAAHAEVTRIRHEHRMTTAQRLIDLLRAGSEGTEAAIVARSLGFRPEGRFCALTWSNAGTPAEFPDLNRIIRSCSGIVAVGLASSTTVLLTQSVDVSELVENLCQASDGFGGVSMERIGLDRADECVSDALTALGMAGPGHPVVWMEQDWLTAILVSRRAHLAPLLGPAPEVAARNDKIVAAIRALRDADMSLSAAAARIGVHPNTIKYRLNRWHELTGIDARTHDGLVLSILACHLMTVGDGTV